MSRPEQGNQHLTWKCSRCLTTNEPICPQSQTQTSQAPNRQQPQPQPKPSIPTARANCRLCGLSRDYKPVKETTFEHKDIPNLANELYHQPQHLTSSQLPTKAYATPCHLTHAYGSVFQDTTQGTVFGLWAPNADCVGVCGDFNNWNPCAHLLHRVSNGWFVGRVETAVAGTEYLFSVFPRPTLSPSPSQTISGPSAPQANSNTNNAINNNNHTNNNHHNSINAHGDIANKSNNNVQQQNGANLEGAKENRDGYVLRNDPCGLILRTSATFSNSNVLVDVVVDRNEFQWSDDDFERPKWNTAVAYQICIHTFTQEGTWKSATSRLQHDKQFINTNCLCLLPHTQDAHISCWGYDPISLFSVHASFGAVNDFKAFVDVAHSLGIAVVMDFVPNHLSSKNVHKFIDCAVDAVTGMGMGDAGLGSHFSSNKVQRSTPYGPRLDLSNKQVANHVIASLEMWLREFHIDGVRVDSTLTLRRYDSCAHAPPHRDMPHAWSEMQRWNDLVRRQFPGRLMIAEDLQNSSRMTRQCAGFESQWDNLFFDRLYRVCIALHDSDRDVSSVANSITHAHSHSSCIDRVIFAENHDTVPNDRQWRLADALGETSSLKIKSCCLALGVILTSPGVPMILQGQEFLDQSRTLWPQPPNAGLSPKNDRDRGGITQNDRLAMFHATQDLISLRRNKFENTKGLTGDHVSMIQTNSHARVLIFHRWMQGGPGDDVIVVANFSRQNFPQYIFGVPRLGVWKVRFDSSVVVDNNVVKQQKGKEYSSEEGFYDEYPFLVRFENLLACSMFVLSMDGSD